MLRLFVAVEIEDPGVLSNVIKARDLVSGSGADLKPVEDENIHLTLRFLGDVDEPLIPGIERALESLSSFKPFTMRITGLGAFPSTRSPRVVWAGVSEGSEILRAMRDVLERGLRGLRIHRDEHEFHPHITLARVRSPRNADKLARLIEDSRDLDMGVTPVTRVLLKRSTLTPRGPLYADIRRVFLGGGGEAGPRDLGGAEAEERGA